MRLLRVLAVGATILAISLPATALAQATADLSVSLSGRVRGETVTWTINVENLGPGEATNVSLEAFWGSDAVGLSATTTQGTCRGGGGIVIFSLGTIAPGESVTATLVIQAFGGDSGNLSVFVGASERDPNERNNSARGRVRIVPGPPGGSLPFGTFCAPVGGVSTGGGGSAPRSQPWLATVGLMAMAGLITAAIRLVRR